MDEIWEGEVPDLEASAAQDGVTAEELDRLHVSGIDSDFEDQFFDADVAFYDCLEECCITGMISG